MGIERRAQFFLSLSLFTSALAICTAPVAATQPAVATAAVLPASFIVTQFAVPVAVPQYAAPVAPPSYVQYGGYSTSSLDSLEDRIVAKVLKGLQSAGHSSVPVPQQTLVTRTCAACHSGSAPKAGLDLSDLTKLTADARLRAVAAVLADDTTRRMPPASSSQKLSAEDLGKLLQELSQTPKEVHP